MKNKKFKLNRLGFTLVELLAVIAILSVVMSVVLYFVIDTVRVARNNSYQVTISNIESEVSSYVSEQNKSSDWIYNNGGKTQYQCVTVQNLIDKGYFKGDVLDSYVDDNTKVKATDYVYIERDINTKTITKSIFKPKSFGLCYGYDENENVRVRGEISFIVTPESTVTRKYYKMKKINIHYQLFDYDKLDNYKYNYVYRDEANNKIKEFNGSFSNNDDVFVELEVNVNGTLTAIITDKNGNFIKYATQTIDNIDNIPPVITCNAAAAIFDSKDKESGKLIHTYKRITECPSYINDCDNYFQPNECAVYMEPLHACGTSIYSNPDSVLVVTDNSGRFTKDRGNTGVILNENGKIVNNLQHTKCNCDDGYCSWTWTMTAVDEAGNEAVPKSFTYYATYHSVVSKYNGVEIGCVDEKKIFNNFVEPTCPFK